MTLKLLQAKVTYLNKMSETTENPRPSQQLIDEYEALASQYEAEVVKRSQFLTEIDTLSLQIEEAKKEIENMSSSTKNDSN